MKKTAFIQATILFLLLAGTWFLLAQRLMDRPDVEPTVADTASDNSSLDKPDHPGNMEVDPKDRSPGTTNQDFSDKWQPWLDRFEQVGSREEMVQLLGALRSALLALPKEEAINRILAFLDTDVDVETGLAFQVGAGHRLVGAPHLRPFLLDWLFDLDPALSAELAREYLDTQGTRLRADEYALHLRNFGLGSDEPDGVVNESLQQYLEDMLDDPEWMRNPSAAVAESLDVAVYAEAVELAPRLSAMMQYGQPSLLRHASSIALERLVDRAPVATLAGVLNKTAGSSAMSKARAGYFARLDPDLEGARLLLDTYLSAPGVSPDEVGLFLQYFPNLNQSFSHNLLSTNKPITEPGGYVDRLENALDQVRGWQSDPNMQAYQAEIEETARRLEAQLSSGPVPGQD